TRGAECQYAGDAAQWRLAHSAGCDGVVAGAWFQPAVVIEQSRVGSEDSRDSKHAARGEPPESRSCRHRQHARRGRGTRLPAHGQADLVIMYQHNHIFDKPFGAIFTEELPERLVPPPWIKKWTHEEIDAGADIVVMHGAPVVQGVEIYRGKPIFYDLGNFIFNM